MHSTLSASMGYASVIPARGRLRQSSKFIWGFVAVVVVVLEQGHM